MKSMDADRLREELFLMMVRASRTPLPDIDDDQAALYGEHAARLAKAAIDGVGYYDRTGQVRNPRRQED